MSVPPESLAWTPTPDDLAALLRARTKDDNGTELGEWTDDTRPTLAEVQALIDMAAGELVGVDGPGDACASRCRAAVAYRTACLIELSYFPEQVRSDRSPYTELKELADTALGSLQTCLTSGSTDGQAGGEGYGYHSLPIDAETMALYGSGAGWRYPEYPATWQRACVAPTPAEPAQVLIPEPPPLPPIDIELGYPGEGDPDRGLPPIITDQ